MSRLPGTPCRWRTCACGRAYYGQRETCENCRLPDYAIKSIINSLAREREQTERGQRAGTNPS